MSDQDFVIFESASFSYDGANAVFHDLDLTVPQGQFLCLLGGNGSGKSTLAKCINALLTPDSGRVLTFGRATTDTEATYFIRSNAGLVFQNPDDQLVASLVENDVAFGPENLGVSEQELPTIVAEALATVGLQGFELRETSSLSGGQKQRVAIAGILAMDPAMLILDEASAMLDPRGRAGLLRVCRELHEAGMTIVMITHYMEEATCADRVVVLDKGRICMDGAPSDVLVRTKELRDLSLDVPFAASLSLELRTCSINIAPCVKNQELERELEQLASRARFDKSIDQNSKRKDRIPVPSQESANLARVLERETAGALDETSIEIEREASHLMSPSLLSLRDVSFSYLHPKRMQRMRNAREGQSVHPAATHAEWGSDPESLWALRHIDLDIHEGEFLGIAGHTGSGKSTLIQMMNGLLEPTEGQVLFGSQELTTKAAIHEARRSVGLVFQYPEYQLFAATVYDDVAFGPRNQKRSPEQVDACVRGALANVGLAFDDVAQKSPFELSGGQQRRVALAGVLAMEPSILVLDEPAAGLDPQGREELLSLIRTLHQRGLTCVMVSHSMDDLARMAERILILNEGEVFACDIPSLVFANEEALHSIGLGVPSAQALARSLQRKGWLLDRMLYDEAALAEDLSALLSPSATLPSMKAEVPHE